MVRVRKLQENVNAVGKVADVMIRSLHDPLQTKSHLHELIKRVVTCVRLADPLQGQLQ